MQYREIIAVCSESPSKHIIATYWQRTIFLTLNMVIPKNWYLNGLSTLNPKIK
jgi:hypothetical protein